MAEFGTSSEEEADVTHDLIAVNLTEFGVTEDDMSNVNCEYSKAQCVMTRSDWCKEGFNLARLAAKLTQGKQHFIFMNVSEAISSVIHFTARVICPMDFAIMATLPHDGRMRLR